MFERACLVFFFFNEAGTTKISPLSQHAPFPIPARSASPVPSPAASRRSSTTRCGARSISTRTGTNMSDSDQRRYVRSEEHTSELQSRQYLVCRLLLEKKKKRQKTAANSSPNTKY